MREEYRRRWDDEIHRLQGKLAKPQEVLRRSLGDEDFIDSAIIGGTAVTEIIAGKISESQIPQDVRAAFHAQYPQNGHFVDAVQHLSGHPEQLRGLISGVKGKLFELNYTSWLNSGHLPTGQFAELAKHANNPVWDIVIKDSQGHVNGLLQSKATEIQQYVRQAIEAHPNVDVVVPHELYQRMADHPEILSHLIDGQQPLKDLTEHVSNAAEHADAADIHFHLPLIAIGFIVAQNCMRYRKSTITLGEAVRNVGERGALAVIAVGAGWAAALLAHEPMVGAPVSFITRFFGRQAMHNYRRREHLAGSLEITTASIRMLRLQVLRPVLELSD
jgi:hypothetical protein